MDGIINFYKPKGMTSHDAVYYFRKLLNIKRIGHGGTLDPNVEGVLPICIGRATRIAEYLLEADKEYIGNLNLSYSTDTQDSYGKIINHSLHDVSREDIINSFDKFKGDIKQIPPMYSALKFKGKKLYDLAREGKTIEREARNTKIYELDIISNRDNISISFYTKCSKGTYIRTLCNDIATDLGLYGHMSKLIRIGVGDFNIKESKTTDFLSNASKQQIEDSVIPLDWALNNFEKIVIEDSLYKKLVNGVNIPIEKGFNKKNLLKVYCKSEFIGIGEIISNDSIMYLKMKKVFVNGGNNENN